MRRRSTSQEFKDKLKNSEEYAMFFEQVQDASRKESSNSSSGGTGSDNAPLLGADAGEATEEVVPIIQHSSFSRAAMHYLENQIAFRHHILQHDQQRREIPLTHRLGALKHGHTLHRASRGFHVSSAAKHKAGSKIVIGEHVLDDCDYDYERSEFVEEGPHAYEIRAFCRQIDEETDPDPIVIDALGISPPCCECEERAELRRFVRPQTESTAIDHRVWVCRDRSCMLWLAADHLTPQVVSTDAASTPQDTSPSSSVSGIELSSNKDEDEKRDTMDEFNRLKLGTLTPGSRARAVAKFWSVALPEIVTLEEEASKVLVSNQTVLQCSCGVDCSVCLCKVTGDLFWVCKSRDCVCIALCQERPALAQLDIGQYLGIGRGSIDKYTTVQYIMRWMGYSFSKTYFRKLIKRGPDVGFPRGAMDLEAGEEYEAFISYRGGTGKFVLWLTMCGIFHIKPAFCYLVGFLPFLVLALSFVKDPCSSGVPVFFLGSKSCDPPSPTPPTLEDELAWFPPMPHQWFVFRSWGVGIMLAIVFFWFPTMSWTKKCFKIFFDKLKKKRKRFVQI